jgi:hypothetical protein
MMATASARTRGCKSSVSGGLDLRIVSDGQASPATPGQHGDCLGAIPIVRVNDEGAFTRAQVERSLVGNFDSYGLGRVIDDRCVLPWRLGLEWSVHRLQMEDQSGNPNKDRDSRNAGHTCQDPRALNEDLASHEDMT